MINTNRNLTQEQVDEWKRITEDKVSVIKRIKDWLRFQYYKFTIAYFPAGPA
jgi:hypothetical protein